MMVDGNLNLELTSGILSLEIGMAQIKGGMLNTRQDRIGGQ
jgi:hypothetical protein